MEVGNLKAAITVVGLIHIFNKIRWCRHLSLHLLSKCNLPWTWATRQTSHLNNIRSNFNGHKFNIKVNKTNMIHNKWGCKCNNKTQCIIKTICNNNNNIQGVMPRQPQLLLVLMVSVVNSNSQPLACTRTKFSINSSSKSNLNKCLCHHPCIWCSPNRRCSISNNKWLRQPVRTAMVMGICSSLPTNNIIKNLLKTNKSNKTRKS